MKVVIKEISFPDNKFPHLADIYYSLVGPVSQLDGNMRIGVPQEFIDKITKDATEILKTQINTIEPCKKE